MSHDRPDRPPPRRGLVGRILGGRYRVTHMVSAGASTLIVDAHDEETGRAVTVKLVRPEWAESDEFRRRFRQVMEAMSTLSHPNIAAIYDWGEEVVGKRTTVYGVGEYLAGGSLRDLFDRGRYLDPSQALLVGLEACRGLDFAHHKGLIHTELTPSKLVFGEDRRLRIVDFGLARLLGRREWDEPATVATHVARYASPEQALAQPLDGKSDVYSLALILVEAVTEQVPFAARSTVATLSARIGRLMPVSADLGPLAAVLEHAGRPQAADRSTAAELGRALVRVAEKLPRPAPIPILVAAPIVDDTSRLRRPNDPTGGVTRPEPEPAAPIVPPPPRPVTGTVVPPTPPPPPPPPSDEEKEEEAPAPSAAPDPPPSVEVAPPPDAAAPPAVYDGDTDATKDELAVLARPPATATLLAEREPTPDVTAPPPDAGDPGATPVAEPDPPRSRWFIALIAFLVLAALAALGFVASLLFRVPSHEVPDLAGLEAEQAEARIADFEWEIQVERQRSDEEPDVGQVIRSVPPAGFDLGEGEPFLLIVSDGPELRTLPELGGVALAEAETTLAELRLRATTVAEEHHEDVPAGSVISWAVAADPALAAGAEVLPDTEIGLVVSLGPAPRTVPDVAELTVADATAQIEALRLDVELAAPEFDNEIPAGAVIASDPEPGTSVERGSTVTLRTSKGPDLVTLPDLVGLGLAEARAQLTQAGLQAGAVIGNTQGAVAQMLVANRSVEAGTQYLRNSVVDLALI
jgi:serine/threonine-protein kinase